MSTSRDTGQSRRLTGRFSWMSLDRLRVRCLCPSRRSRPRMGAPLREEHGCVGILEQWLTKALHSVFRRGGNTIIQKIWRLRPYPSCNARRFYRKKRRESRVRRNRRGAWCASGAVGSPNLRDRHDQRGKPTSAPRNTRRPGMRRPQRERIGVGLVRQALNPGIWYRSRFRPGAAFILFSRSASVRLWLKA